MTSRPARIAAMTTAVLSTAAVPVAFAATGAWTPQVPSPAAARGWIAEPMSTGFVIVLAQAGAVMLWLLLFTAVLTHVYTAVARRLRWTATLRLPGPFQGLAAALLGATAVTTATAATAHASPATTSGMPAAEPVTATPTGHQAGQDPRPSGQTSTYTVRRGDSLCRIAERALGDADRWPEIFALNRGTRFPHVGGTLRDPNLIYPGWTLHLPADATPPPRPPHPPADTAPPPTSGPDERAAPDASETSPPSPAPVNPRQSTAPEPAATAAPDSGAVSTGTSPGESVSRGADDTSRAAGHAWRGVLLPSGSWVELGLACALAVAVALVWAHRQRRYVPRTSSARPRRDDPALTPMPRVVAQIRRGLRRVTAAPGGEQGSVRTGGERHDQKPDHHNQASAGVGDTEAGGPFTVVPALNNPPVSRWPSAGLGLTGPGAEAAARGFLIAALAAGGADHPDARAEVVIPAATAAALLNVAAVDLPRTPRLTVTASLNEALTICEAQVMHRARLLHQHDADTVTQLRAVDPYEEPLPPVMLLANATGRGERARLAALLTQGHRLDIHGVLLGAWPDGDTVDVAADGSTTPADIDTQHGSHPGDIGRLTVLNPAETIDLLATLAESHTGQPPAPAYTAPDLRPTPAHTTTTATTGTEQQLATPPAIGETSGHDADAGDPDKATDAPGREAGTTSADPPTAAIEPDVTATPVPVGGADTAPATGGTSRSSASALPVADAEPVGLAGDQAPLPARRDRVEVTVLGAPAIVDADPQRKPRAKSLELLVYLTVCDGDASTDAILDDLLPDAPTSRATHRLHTYVSDLRAVLRHTAGPGTYLTRLHHRYQLNPDRFDIDLWRMRAAIRAADTAASRTERITALRRAVDTYRPLAQGCDYEWLEPHRHAVQQEALNAVAALVEELADHPDQQAAVCENALQHHPYAETLYQAAMRTHARLGHVDTIRALRRTLTRRLAEIDAEPDDDTLTLADRLITDLRQPRPGRHSPRPSDDGPSA